MKICNTGVAFFVHFFRMSDINPIKKAPIARKKGVFFSEYFGTTFLASVKYKIFSEKKNFIPSEARLSTWELGWKRKKMDKKKVTTTTTTEP
jgi:hypothetical protein